MVCKGWELLAQSLGSWTRPLSNFLSYPSPIIVPKGWVPLPSSRCAPEHAHMGSEVGVPTVERVIFLDIDGVICCNSFGRLEENKLQLLKSVVDSTGAKVVLSTDWRRWPKLKQQRQRRPRRRGKRMHAGSVSVRALLMTKVVAMARR